jgi:uncharacterized membrane protein YgaE (UPF0421/DUF939 family)
VARRSRFELDRRLTRVRERAFFILQSGIAAAAAWFVAHHLFGHPVPFFAPVTAIIVLGLSYGHRLRRGLELMVGVALGILVGDAFSHLAGRGWWQIAVVVVIAMAGAAFLSSGTLLASQAGVQAVFVTTLVPAPGQGFSRWTDAVIGGVVALALGLIAPLAPLRRPRTQAARALREVAAIVRTISTALAAGSEEAAWQALVRARASEHLLDELRAAAAEGLAVVRFSPLVRRHAGDLRAVSDLLAPLDHCVRNLRVLARRAHVATWRDEPVPTAYLALLTSLAEAAEDVAAGLETEDAARNARAAVLRVGELSASIGPSTSLSGEVLRAQMRSMVVDLLMVTGLTYDEASDLVPEVFDA